MTMMMTSILSQSSHEEEDFILYQPYPTKQVLLYDGATSSSVLTYLKMNRFTTLIRNLGNTEFMSENGRMPVVVERDNDKPLCGFGEVFWHVCRKKNYTPTLLELAYMDWIEVKFIEAEMYICWCHEPIVNSYTKARYTHDLSWPVSSILFNRKKSQMQASVGKKFKTYEDFLEKFNQFLTSLDKWIRSQPQCLSESSPSCVAALIYGHTNVIMSTALDPRLKDAITKQRRITSLAESINKNYPS